MLSPKFQPINGTFKKTCVDLEIVCIMIPLQSIKIYILKMFTKHIYKNIIMIIKIKANYNSGDNTNTLLYLQARQSLDTIHIGFLECLQSICGRNKCSL